MYNFVLPPIRCLTWDDGNGPMFESVRGLGDTKGREKHVFHEKLVLVPCCETFYSVHGRKIVFGEFDTLLGG